MRYLPVVALIAARAQAQTLESRVANAGESVAFSYDTRANVCGNGSSIEISQDSSDGWMYRSDRRGVHYGTRYDGRNDPCERGPARVVLRKADGRVSQLSVSVGGPTSRADTELGAVSAMEASKYLLSLAPKLEGRSGDHAVLGAVIADRAIDWQALLRIARDGDASDASRKASVFWVSQEATVAARRGVDSLATDDDGSLAVRKDALFYIAQRPNGEGVPVLIKVVETSKSRKLREDAIWFLGQSRDERALALFEKLLAGR